jgi:hypothetical protein
VLFWLAAPCRDILRAQAGLAEHHDNYHKFCGLLLSAENLTFDSAAALLWAMSHA